MFYDFLPLLPYSVISLKYTNHIFVIMDALLLVVQRTNLSLYLVRFTTRKKDLYILFLDKNKDNYVYN